MLGFSAGDHLASAAATQLPAATRLAFLALAYPAIAGDLLEHGTEQFPATDKGIDGNSPPTFLVHTHEDDTVPVTQSLRFYAALLEAGVPAELHLFGAGGHGLGLAPGDPDLGRWPDLLLGWLRRRGLLQSAARATVSGEVTLGGRPMFWGWITFNPVSETAPTAIAYIGWRAEGHYRIESDEGPVPGAYSVTVHRVAAAFEAPTNGAYSLADAERHDWLDGGQPVVVTIEPGDNHVDVALP